jgi:hypothetical protein
VVVQPDAYGDLMEHAFADYGTQHAAFAHAVLTPFG